MVHQTTASAPGKVLLTGGYLVLDPAYEGVVISTTARFYSVVRNARFPNSGLEGEKRRRVVVRSPQFKDAVWAYDLIILERGSSYSLEDSRTHIQLLPRPELNPSTSPNKNKFVELALRETMKLVEAVVGVERIEDVFELDEYRDEGGLEIDIKGDNSFYSQRETVSVPCPSSSPKI